MVGTALLRFAGRTLIGATVGEMGLKAMLDPGGRVAMAQDTLDAIRKVVPLPVDNETIVRANGGVMALSGALLSLGVAPKVAAAAMLAALVPTTQAGHAFWKIKDDDAKRAAQKTQFQKNLAIMGGLVYIIAGD